MSSSIFDVQELHQDLARKYRNVGTKVDAIWRNLTPKQRESTVRNTYNGKILKHKNDPDPDLRTHLLYFPEFNLLDMASEPNYFSDLFGFRALTLLQDQLHEGFNGAPGDLKLIEATGMSASKFPNEERTVFLDGEHYGQSFMPGPALNGILSGLSLEKARRNIVPRKYGELILGRQRLLYCHLNHMVTEVLYLRTETATKKAPAKHANEALVTAFSKLNVQPQPLKSSLPEVRTQALDSRQTLEDYLHLLRNEPAVLNQAVNTVVFSRTELVPDEQGLILPLNLDRYLSTALFSVMTTVVKAIATWDYMFHLLRLLEGGADKAKRLIIMQELSNTSHLEYRRTQDSFRHKVAHTYQVADKCFKRVTDQISGRSRIVMKGQPEDFTVSDPQLHYILRLCHPNTSATDAVHWLQKLEDHNARHAKDRRKLDEIEMDALGDVAIIVGFMHQISTAVPMAPVSRKSGLLFTARLTELETELDKLKPKVEFGDYVLPMGNLLEPQMAVGALDALENFVTQETGVGLGSLFESIVQDSMTDLEKIYAEAKARLEEADNQTTYVPLPTESASSSNTKLADRRAKEKTRPTGSVYTITPLPETPQVDIIEPVQQFKVKLSTATLFSTLFSRSGARGSVSWTGFESAMVDLGFSVTPKGGSVITFNPPASMAAGPATIHRPHGSEIEGHKLLNIARTLQRVYGWTSGSFVVA